VKLGEVLAKTMIFSLYEGAKVLADNKNGDTGFVFFHIRMNVIFWGKKRY
jgi:hypothetical protein